MTDKLTVKGKPLNSKTLENQATITELDIKRSINQSDSRIKKYLRAKY